MLENNNMGLSCQVLTNMYQGARLRLTYKSTALAVLLKSDSPFILFSCFFLLFTSVSICFEYDKQLSLCPPIKLYNLDNSFIRLRPSFEFYISLPVNIIS